jgi:hypothetical protein
MSAPFRESEHVAKVAEYERRLSEIDAQRAWVEARIQRLERTPKLRPVRWLLLFVAFLFVSLFGFCGSCAVGVLDRSLPITCPTGPSAGQGHR